MLTSRAPNNLPAIPPVVQDGRARPLVITTVERSASLPGAPSAPEAGLPAYVTSAFFTLAAPASTPPAVLDALNADLRAVLAQPGVRQRLIDLGATPRGLTVPEIRAYFLRETETWTKVIAAAGLKVE